MFKRSKNNPILEANPNNEWESLKLYNPGAISHNGEYHLFYRAVGKGDNWKSSIGYAVSKDAETFERFNEPLLTGTGKFEERGLEDPRITKVGDLFYMVYAAYDGTTPRLSIATSKDLRIWDKKGSVFSDWNFTKAGGTRIKFDDKGMPFTKPKLTEWSKSGGIFPEKIDGKFWMLFGEYNMWFATSYDGIHWSGDHIPFLNPRKGNCFDNTFVEMGPPPIKTEKGWLVLYHGVDDSHWYRIGFLLLDSKNPRKILYRSEKPIFWPKEDYEMSGIVDVLPGGLTKMQKMSDKKLAEFVINNDEKNVMPRVIFCCGAVADGDILRIYYGASDSVICTATANISDILKLD